MPTSGSVISFNQSLPIYADKPFIDNTISASFYNSFSENYIGSSKFLLTTITGINDEDVRISKRKTLSTRRLRGFEKGKIGPVDSDDHIGGNYAASANFDLSLPNFLPESSNMDVSLFLDVGNVWGVDYDDSIDESNKLRSSTGVSASWISPVGPLTFTFAQNLAKSSTDKTESFNFNLGTTFLMYMIFKKLLVIVVLIFFQSNLSAEIPHFLDFRFVLNESTAGKKAQTELKNKLEKGIKNIREKEKKLQEQEKTIISQKKVLKPEEYKKKVNELRLKVSNLQKERKVLIDQTSASRNKARNELLKNLNPIIKKYMQEKQIRMVVDKKSLLLADDKLDITKDIIALLNKQLKSISLK